MKDLTQYLKGNGLDIGHGGVRPHRTSAICLDREEGHPHRGNPPNPWPTHLVGDAADLYWFRDRVLSYVFSSHCLEDFQDTTGVLREWLRVIEPGGYLMLVLPDQAAYVKHCAERGLSPNPDHQHPAFSLEYVKNCLRQIRDCWSVIVQEEWKPTAENYSFTLVVQK